jgi:hypothetical protein
LKQCWEGDYMARPDINDILRLLVRLLKLNGGDPRDNRMETLPREFQLLQLEDEVESAKVVFSSFLSFSLDFFFEFLLLFVFVCSFV